MTASVRRRTQIAVTFWSISPASVQTKCLLSPCFYRVPTTSALGGAKVDMSTIHINYQRLSACRMIFRRCARPSTNKIGFLIIRSGAQRHVVDSFQINLQPRKDDTLSGSLCSRVEEKLLRCGQNVRQPVRTCLRLHVKMLEE